MNDKKRLGAFLFYNEKGVVGEYVDFLLNKINEHLSDLIIICNGNVNCEGKKVLGKYSQNIFYRENIGYDAAGWKDLFTRFISGKDINKYDEIVLFNDSFFGPIQPLKYMFETMDDKTDLDFWGVTSHGRFKAPYLANKVLPEHLQSYFLVIRSNMFNSDDFQDYWKSMMIPKTLEEAIECYETTFTHHFEEKGYKWDSYVKQDGYILDNDKNINSSSYHLESLIIDNKCPFLKRKALVEEISDRLAIREVGLMDKCLEYIDKDTFYPIELIRRQLIRTVNYQQLYEAFHLEYILPENCLIHQPGNHKVAVVIYLNYPTLLKQCVKYIKSAKQYADIFLITDKWNEKDAIERICIENNLSNIQIIQDNVYKGSLAGLLLIIGNKLLGYEYACFIHDNKPLSTFYIKENEMFPDATFESMLSTEKYVCNVIGLFESDELLGVLQPQMPYEGKYFNLCYGNKTENNIPKTRLMRRMGINVKENADIIPLSSATPFWCRTNALAKLFNYEWDVTDFDNENDFDSTIASIYGNIAQDAGFYTGILYSTRYASLVLANTKSILKLMYKKVVVLDKIKTTNIRSVLNSLDKKKNSEKKQHNDQNNNILKSVYKKIKKRIAK